MALVAADAAHAEQQSAVQQAAQQQGWELSKCTLQDSSCMHALLTQRPDLFVTLGGEDAWPTALPQAALMGVRLLMMQPTSALISPARCLTPACCSVCLPATRRLCLLPA